MPATIHTGISNFEYVVSCRSIGVFTDVIQGSYPPSVETRGVRDSENGEVFGAGLNQAILGILVGDCVADFLFGGRSLVVMNGRDEGLGICWVHWRPWWLHDISLTDLGDCSDCRANQYFPDRLRDERERLVVGVARTP